MDIAVVQAIVMTRCGAERLFTSRTTESTAVCRGPSAKRAFSRFGLRRGQRPDLVRSGSAVRLPGKERARRRGPPLSESDPALYGWLSWSSARPSTINPRGVGYAEHAAAAASPAR